MSRRRALLLQAAAGGFSPTDIGWHSLFWAEGPDFVAQAYSNGDPVSTWPNETTEKNATQTLTARPTYTASAAAFNSKPVVTFGASQHMATAAFTANPTYPVSIVLVGAAGSATSFPVFYDGIGVSNRNAFYVTTGTSKWTLVSGTAEVFSSGSSDTSPHLFVASFNSSATNETLHVDNTLQNNGNAGSHTLTGLKMGANHSTTSSTFLNGSIALLGIYSGDITADGDWAAFQSWITSHYGITLS